MTVAGALLAILRSCDYLFATANDVIIRQGERGDRFEMLTKPMQATNKENNYVLRERYLRFRLFVVLAGTVSVYVDGKSTGEQTTLHSRDVTTEGIHEKLDHVLSNLEERHIKREKCTQTLSQLLAF